MASSLPIANPAPREGLFDKVELQGHSDRTFHAYVHIPFCTVRCGYCDFNTYTATELRGLRQSDYSKHLISEIAFAKKALENSGVKERKLETIFFGGGTPTLLEANDLVEILESLRTTFGISSSAEITIEANPDTVTQSKLATLREAGFNRISFGMQSSDLEVLKTLERSHNPANVEASVQLAKNLDFQTSVDLIFGAPGESLESWRKSVETAIALGTDHISAYALIVEDGTKLSRQIASGKLKPLDEDLQAEKYELADDLFLEAGYKWYEISNWAKSDFTRSKHNLAYWKGMDWWGFGPGAHSHLGSTRWWNLKHPASYAKALSEANSPAVGREFLEAETANLERILLESRISDGIAIGELKKLSKSAHRAIPQLIADGLIDGAAAVRDRLILTRRGRLMADYVVRELTA